MLFIDGASSVGRKIRLACFQLLLLLMFLYLYPDLPFGALLLVMLLVR
jgi:hypothetical protein